MNPVSVGPRVSVGFKTEGARAVVTLNRPAALNAIDPETHDELLAAWERFRDDERLRVAILHGAGSRAFCAGIDLKRLDDFYREGAPGERRDRWMRSPGLGGLTRNFDPGKPIIAAIHGFCLGAGLELALACDIRIASRDAVLGLPEVRWGIIPGQGGTQRLPRTIPPGLAMELILTAGTMDAERAHAVGLVNRVVPRRRLMAEARALADKIAAHPEGAVRRAREAVRRGLDLPLADGLRLEQDLADPLRGTPLTKRKVLTRLGRKPSRR
ncbi:MAG TPA: enoyl-CoA hydratase/isomerase family protein [Thermoplasmata archaeon]|nr:enoyl-CoA hydratase/isomerase family protein [Thermoplasmata archaeon]